MAQKNKTQSKVRPAAKATSAGAGKKVAPKTSKPASVQKAVPAKAAASKASLKPEAKKPEAKKASKPQAAAAAKPAAKPVKAAVKPAPEKKAAAAPVAKSPAKAAAAPAAAPKATAAKAGKPADAAKVAAKTVAPAAAGARAAASAKGQPQRVVAAAVASPAAEKISAPVAAAAKPQEKKAVGQRHGFKMNEHVVYPAHGVGRIIGIEEQEIAGHSLELFVITFDKEKLTLRVPTGKLESVGMRKLSEGDTVKKAMETLKGRARVKRTMWSRRAQEYVAKINSGSLISIAEVVRDLYRSEAQPEQSYSERQLYEDALDRMAREIAAVDKLDERGAVQKITEVLSKSAKGRRAATETEEAEAA